ncbi:unnamed protein product, partial [Closterium sp. NIES-65]
HAEVRAWWDDARPAVTSVWLPPTRPADHALEGKPRRRRCDESSFSHVCWLLPLRPWGRGGSAAGSKRTSLLNPRLPSLQGLTWGEGGRGAARAASRGVPLVYPPPSIPFSMAGSVETTRRLPLTEEGDGAGARASRGVPLVNPPPSIPFSMAGVETTRRAARTEVDSWARRARGAARGSKRLLSNLPLPFPFSMAGSAEVLHGGRHSGRHKDRAGRVQDPKTAPDCGIGFVRQGWLTALGRTRPAPEAPLCVSECSDEGWGDTP